MRRLDLSASILKRVGSLSKVNLQQGYMGHALPVIGLEPVIVLNKIPST